MTVADVVVVGLAVLFIIGGGLMLWLAWAMTPKPCRKCGRPGVVVNEKTNRWYCFDHMGAE